MASHSEKLSSKPVKKHILFVRDDDGNPKEFKTTDTLWYLLYINQEPRNERMRKQFCSRFRMIHISYLELADDMPHHELFQQWVSNDATNKKPCEIKVLLLGLLRYLGR